jgi:hypothetical protein
MNPKKRDDFWVGPEIRPFFEKKIRGVSLPPHFSKTLEFSRLNYEENLENST